MNKGDVHVKGPLAQEPEVQALIRLLDDEDPVVFEAVRQRLLSYGSEVSSILSPYLSSENGLVRRRVRSILRKVQADQADEAFLAYCLKAQEFLDLGEALLLLARTRYPDISIDGYQALLDAFEAQLLDRVHGRRTSLGNLALLNNLIFGELEIRCVHDKETRLEHFYLNRVLDQRAGHRILLCALYVILARRIRLPVAPIDLAGHFLCRFQSMTEAIYIDPSHRGRMLTRKDCLRYIQRLGLNTENVSLHPLTPRQFLIRICEALCAHYHEIGAKDESLRLYHYIVALRKS